MDKHEVRKVINRIKDSSKYYGVKCYKEMPKGYKEIKGALTAPNGAIWAYNGESILSGKRKRCFVLEPWFKEEMDKCKQNKLK